MDFLLAKVNDDKDNPFYKLMSFDKLYQRLPDVSTAVEYSPSTILNEDECYKIESFSNKGFMNDLMRITLDSSFPQFKKKLESIEYICSFQDNRYLCYQRAYKSRIIQKRWVLSFDVEPALNEQSRGLLICDYPDAVYDRHADVLFFRELSKISNIFLGISSLYTAATDDEVNEFITMPFVEITGNYGVERVGKQNRIRISKAKDILNSLTNEEKNKLFSYTEDYAGIECSDGVFKISCDEDMKKLLYGIDQRYYTTGIGNEKRIANSIIVLK